MTRNHTRPQAINVAAFAAAFVSLLAPPPDAQTVIPATKRALLIGVSEYARQGGADEWWNLASSADVAALRTTLVEKFAFSPQTIATLTTRAQTTRASILAAFEALIRQTGKGDVVFIHYSGHGAPVPDRNGDEVDGLDEALVPSDYVSRSDGARSVTDDEIAALLARLQSREPANVTLTFDSCFSGTQTRAGRMTVRGGNYLNPPIVPRRDPEVTGLLDGRAYVRGHVAIAAARHDQLATETDDDSGGAIGLLTYALVRQMRAAGPATTYRDLFDGVVDIVARRSPVQSPQLEGDLDAVLFSGAGAPVAPYLETRLQGTTVVLQAGSLHGVTPGSRFALFPPDTRDFAAAGALAHAEAATVRSTTTVLKVTDAIDRDRLRGARAIEVSHQHGDAALRLDISQIERLPGHAGLRTRLERFAADRGLVHLTQGGEWHLKLCPLPCPEALAASAAGRDAMGAATLIRHDGSAVAVPTEPADLPDALTLALEREARWRMVGALDRRDPRIQVEVRPVPVAVTLNANGLVERASRLPTPKRAAGGPLRLAIGEYFMVEVRNTGAYDAFVTVLELSSDGSLHPLWPHPRVGSRVQENRLHGAVTPGKADWVLLPLPYVFAVGPPAGVEIIKAIATSTPTDFSSLFEPAGATRGDAAALQSPIGRLLASAIRGSRQPLRSAEPPDPTVWSTGSFTFVVTDDARAR